MRRLRPPRDVRMAPVRNDSGGGQTYGRHEIPCVMAACRRGKRRGGRFRQPAPLPGSINSSRPSARVRVRSRKVGSTNQLILVSRSGACDLTGEVPAATAQTVPCCERRRCAGCTVSLSPLTAESCFRRLGWRRRSRRACLRSLTAVACDAGPARVPRSISRGGPSSADTMRSAAERGQRGWSSVRRALVEQLRHDVAESAAHAPLAGCVRAGATVSAWDGPRQPPFGG